MPYSAPTAAASKAAASRAAPIDPKVTLRPDPPDPFPPDPPVSDAVVPIAWAEIPESFAHVPGALGASAANVISEH